MNSLKIEQECIATCIDALKKVSSAHLKLSSPSDSVSDAHAKRAVNRVLTYVISFVEQQP